MSYPFICDVKLFLNEDLFIISVSLPSKCISRGFTVWLLSIYDSSDEDVNIYHTIFVNIL